jgi:hypothetical protein
MALTFPTPTTVGQTYSEAGRTWSWNGTAWQVVSGYAASSHTHPLSELTQSGATANQVPTWNGTAWVPQTPSSGVTSDANNNFTAGQTITAAANTSALSATYSVTGANTTALVNLSGTWNTTGSARGFRLNITDTASAASSKLLELLNGGSPVFSVEKNGNVTFNTAGIGGFGTFTPGNTPTFSLQQSTGLRAILSPLALTFFTAPASANPVTITGDAANILAQRNGVNAQIKRIYGTFTDASNNRRLDITSTTAGIFTLTATGIGTGATGNLLKLTQPILLPASSVTLATNGDLAFEATSNTQLTIRYRGSDGTTRSATLALT